jgi:hypothetical protein
MTTKNIQISEKLKDVLLQFADNSSIAKTLLQNEFQSDLLKSSDINYLCVSSNDLTKISYLTEDRLQKISQDEIWTSPKRYHQKPGALISKIFKNFTAKEVEKFSNLFRAFSDKKPFEFKIVSGREIKKYYHEDTYQSINGSLGNSCMRYGKCSKFFNMYEDNGLEMLVMLDDNGYLLGRALLWKSEDKKIMDRIYTINDEDYLFYFTFWADTNDYFYKKRQNWSNTLQFIKQGKEYELYLQYKLKIWHYSYYPYIDTFKWVDFDAGILYNYRPNHFKESNDYAVLLSSEGSYNRSTCLEFDSITKDWHHDGTLVWVNYLEIYTHPHNTVYSETLDTNILKKDAIFSEPHQDYIFSDETLNNKDLLDERQNQISEIFKKNKKGNLELSVEEFRRIFQQEMPDYIQDYLEP